MAKIHTEIDHIYYGIMKELGWEAYVQGEQTKPIWFRIPQTTVQELCNILVNKFHLCGARIVGDPNGKVETVFICEHVQGRSHDYEVIAKAKEADVMIPLEIVDWTLTEYVRDACQLGINKAIIEMGHFNTEELGMEYMAKQLAKALEEEVPVRFIQSGDTYHYFVKETV